MSRSRAPAAKEPAAVTLIRQWLDSHAGEAIRGSRVVREADSSGELRLAIVEREFVEVTLDASSTSVGGGQAAVIRGWFGDQAVAVRAEVQPSRWDVDSQRRHLVKMDVAERVKGSEELRRGQLEVLASFTVNSVTPDGFSDALIVDLTAWGTPLDDALDEGGALHGLSLEQRLAAALPMLDSMARLWEDAKVCHRDIDPGNLIVGDDRLIRVTDWGIARHIALQKGYSRTFPGAGKPGHIYFPPEDYRALQEETEVRTGPAGDAWSLGCVLALLLTGVEVQANAERTSHGMPLSSSLPGPVLSVLRGMLKESPDERMTVRAAHDALINWLEDARAARARKVAPTRVVHPPDRDEPGKPVVASPGPVILAGAQRGSRWPLLITGVAAGAAVLATLAYGTFGPDGQEGLDGRPATSTSQSADNDGSHPHAGPAGEPRVVDEPLAIPANLRPSAQKQLLVNGWAKAIAGSKAARLPDGRTSRPALRWRGDVLTVTVTLRSLPAVSRGGLFVRTCGSGQRGDEPGPGIYLVMRGTATGDIYNIRAANPWASRRDADRSTKSLLQPVACAIYRPGEDVVFDAPKPIRTQPDKRWTSGKAPDRFTFTVPRAGLRPGDDLDYPRLIAGLVLISDDGHVRTATTPPTRTRT